MLKPSPPPKKTSVYPLNLHGCWFKIVWGLAIDSQPCEKLTPSRWKYRQSCCTLLNISQHIPWTLDWVPTIPLSVLPEKIVQCFSLKAIFCGLNTCIFLPLYKAIIRPHLECTIQLFFPLSPPCFQGAWKCPNAYGEICERAAHVPYEAALHLLRLFSLVCWRIWGDIICEVKWSIWAVKHSNFQEAIQSMNLHTYFITFSVQMTLMAVQFINVESFFLLRRFIGPKNPLSTACIAHLVFLRRSAKKHGGQVLRPREKKGRKNSTRACFGLHGNTSKIHQKNVLVIIYVKQKTRFYHEK